MRYAGYHSWGRYPRATQRVRRQSWRQDPLPLPAEETESVLPFGNGRSYGDVCLNDGATLIDVRPLDRFIAFDPETGVLRCETGVLLDAILTLSVPNGWFLPVTPGTRFVTLGGAIANDVHGKNHHRRGTFGRHVCTLELLRSDGSRRVCSPAENPELYRATIGGLGLTGLITWAEIRLCAIANPFIDQETLRFDNLDAFFALAEESDRDYEHTVAWVDCLAAGKNLGRGVFIRGNHAPGTPAEPPKPPRVRLKVPCELPVSAINHTTLKLFNTIYYRRYPTKWHKERVHYAPFFHPLDGIGEWNRIYGPKGFLQYQCVVPEAQGKAGLREILERIAGAGTGSFLAVLKRFGDLPSPGLLSFPLAGIALALDFPNQGQRTRDLLADLDVVVHQAGGRLYPAKDARMAAADFQRGYPNWRQLEALRDPRFDSGFWRRVRGAAT